MTAKNHPRAKWTESQWNQWASQAETPSYQPPQLSPGFLNNYLKLCNISTHRTPLCKCLVPCLISCISTKKRLSIPEMLCHYGDGQGVSQVNMLEDYDAFFREMLALENPLTPHHLKGVWWLKDNIAHERFVTFSDGNWLNPRLGFKTLKTNWSRNYSIQGAGLLWYNSSSKMYRQHIEISPNGKWILINGGNWIRVLQEGETMRYPDDWWQVEKRGQIVGQAGDLCRINFSEASNTQSPITYQYIIKRLAYKEGNTLTKTPAFQEYLQSCRNQPPIKPKCCGHTLLGLEEKDIIQLYDYENPQQYIIYANQYPDQDDQFISRPPQSILK